MKIYDLESPDKRIIPEVHMGLKDGVHVPNSKVEWYPTDSLELYKENIKADPTNPTLRYYEKNPIEYSFNNYGFRTPYDFKQGDEVNIFLGCSLTSGVGLHLKDTWGYQVNEAIGGNFVNLGLGGTGADTMFYVLHKVRKMFKIKNIFHLGYVWPRYEYSVNGVITAFTPHHTSDHLSQYFPKKFLVEGLFSDSYTEREYLKTICAIGYIAKEHNAPYYLISKMHGIQDKARDLLHPGPKTQASIARHFLGEYRGTSII